MSFVGKIKGMLHMGPKAPEGALPQGVGDGMAFMPEGKRPIPGATVIPSTPETPMGAMPMSPEGQTPAAPVESQTPSMPEGTPIKMG